MFDFDWKYFFEPRKLFQSGGIVMAALHSPSREIDK